MTDDSIKMLLKEQADEMLAALSASNKHARKRNRIAKQQYRQSLLSYEQVERQYLIQKSNLQPTFRLSVNEFLLSAPIDLDDPELSSEAKYLADLGMSIDEHVLKVRVRVKGDAEYRRPTMVVKQTEGGSSDERMHSMRELHYYISMPRIKLASSAKSFEVFFVYRDKTTLPVVHRYRISQQQGVALSGWDVTHLDTFFVSSHSSLATLNTSEGCAKLFEGRED